MELAVGTRLASPEGRAAVEKCSRVSGRRFSELKPCDSGSEKGRSEHNEQSGRTDNVNPGQLRHWR